MKQPLYLIGIGVGALSTLFLLIAMATVGWMTNNTLDYGLFRYCHKGDCDVFSPRGDETAVRFFVVVGFLLAPIATILCIFHYIKYVTKDVVNKMLPLFAGIEFALAGGAVIIGCIIFAAKVKPYYSKVVRDDFTIGFSFGLGIFGAILAFAACALVMIQRMKS